MITYGAIKSKAGRVIRKGILYQFYRCFALLRIAYDRYYVHLPGNISSAFVFCDICESGADDPFLLRPADSLLGESEMSDAILRARLYFYEVQYSVFLRDQIDLAASFLVIIADYLIAVPAKESFGLSFSPITEFSIPACHR